MDLVPVLIVDDEYLIRSLVRNSVDWKGLGFELVGEAEDGEEALRLVEDLKPRLLIVDINIPFVNGLDLSMRLKESHPEIRVVILTGYEDFQFARRAIKVGVVDYLLKPINSEELARAACAAREALLREDAERGAFRSGLVRSKEEALLALLAGDPDAATAGAAADFGFDPARPLVLCLFDAEPPLAAAELPRLLGLPCEAVSYRDGLAAVVANEDDKTIRLKDKDYYLACAALVERRSAEGGQLSVGLSLQAADLSALPAACGQASAALAEAFYRGPSQIHSYADIPVAAAGGAAAAATPAAPASGESALPALPPRDSLLMELRGGNGGNLVRFARSLFRELGRVRASRGYCEMLCLEIALAANEYLKDAGLSLEEVLGSEDEYGIVRSFKTLAEMEAWLTGLLERAVEAVETTGRTRTGMVAKKAKVFIERNYSRRSLTLEQAAEHVAVSPSYLSSIFKKELGVSVIEYLTNTRLDAAKRSMDADPLLTIIEVSERVGYSDPYYFSKCFRRRFGSAPTAYLRRKNPSVFD